MLILGIHNDDDAGVALIKDNVLIEAVAEERFNRKKLFNGFPIKCLNYLYDKYGLSSESFDVVSYGWHSANNLIEPYLEKYNDIIASNLCNSNNIDCINKIVERSRVEISQNSRTKSLFMKKLEELGFDLENIFECNHHLSHCFGAYELSGFDKALCFSFDGRGDLESSATYVIENHKVSEKLNFELSMHSIGFLYGQITFHLGFKPHRHEGKITGLSALGSHKSTIEIFEKLLWFDESKGSLESDITLLNPFYSPLQPQLIKLLEGHSREDIAAGLQKHVTNLIVQYIEFYAKRVSSEPINICLSGGVAANVLINQAVLELECCKDLFVMQNMGDGGIPLGSALYAYYKLELGKPIKPIRSMYLGSSYSNEEILQALKHMNNVEYKMVDSIASIAAKQLSEGKVVGWFQGRMEYGPRALCHRSILCNANDRSINISLNERMRRTEFMPFAPVLRIEKIKDSFISQKSTSSVYKFMTCTINATDEFCIDHPAVAHLDKTCRPQVIDKIENEMMYNLLEEYERITGKYALINTSFNAHEEPIVQSPEDAINSLQSDVIDVLCIGDFIVSKRV